jgi:hypothetical protein
MQGRLHALNAMKTPWKSTKRVLQQCISAQFNDREPDRHSGAVRAQAVEKYAEGQSEEDAERV